MRRVPHGIAVAIPIGESGGGFDRGAIRWFWQSVPPYHQLLIPGPGSGGQTDTLRHAMTYADALILALQILALQIAWRSHTEIRRGLERTELEVEL